MRTHSSRRARRGFSLPELLISMVMIGIIGVVLTRLIITQSRFSNKQVLQRNARGVSRGALAIMESELRAVEQNTAFQAPSGVTVPAPTTSAIVVNVPWAVGVRCAPELVAILPVDPVQQAIGLGQTALGSATGTNGIAVLNGTTKEYDYDPTPTAIAGTATDVALCTANGINVAGTNSMPQMQVVRLSTPLGSGTIGTPVMLFYRVKYEFAGSTSVPGRRGLFRSVANSGASFATQPEEIVAPFDTSAGFRFYVGDARMPTATVPSDVETITGIELRLDGLSERNTQGRTQPESSNLRTSIFFRNRQDP